MMTLDTKGLPIIIEFSGGAELLFDKKKHEIELPVNQEWTLKLLLFWIKDNILRDRPDLFLSNDTVRPGILVLVNDTDWELLGQGEYKLQPKDTILFISTLHGG